MIAGAKRYRLAMESTGKIRTAYVNRELYDHTVEWLRDAVGKAKIGHTNRLSALKRLAKLHG